MPVYGNAKSYRGNSNRLPHTSGRWCNYNTPTISYTPEELDIIKELG